jgi:triphosphoribosyl-dephospho-CoA synthase
MNHEKQLRYLSYVLASAIALEVAGFPKPGNVHRFRNFVDTIFEDFLVTAVIAEHHLYRAILRGCRLAEGFKPKVLVGDFIEETVRESRTVSGGGNTCLGSTLLLYPLAIACGYTLCSDNVLKPENVAYLAKDLVEKYSTVSDSIHFYNAVRIASPSYIKKDDVTDVFPSVWDERYRERLRAGNHRFWDILLYSSRNDIVCREVVEGYPRSLRNSYYFEKKLNIYRDWNRAVVETYLYQLSNDIDTLIVKKHGLEIALYVSEKAREILDICSRSWEKCLEIVEQFDKELVKKNINPGSSADIVVSSIALYAIKKKISILRP